MVLIEKIYLCKTPPVSKHSEVSSICLENVIKHSVIFWWAMLVCNKWTLLSAFPSFLHLHHLQHFSKLQFSSEAVIIANQA